MKPIPLSNFHLGGPRKEEEKKSTRKWEFLIDKAPPFLTKPSTAMDGCGRRWKRSFKYRLSAGDSRHAPLISPRLLLPFLHKCYLDIFIWKRSCRSD